MIGFSKSSPKRFLLTRFRALCTLILVVRMWQMSSDMSNARLPPGLVAEITQTRNWGTLMSILWSQGGEQILAYASAETLDALLAVWLFGEAIWLARKALHGIRSKVFYRRPYD